MKIKGFTEISLLRMKICLREHRLSVSVQFLFYFFPTFSIYADSTFRGFFENDLLLSDRYYTSGQRLEYGKEKMFSPSEFLYGKLFKKESESQRSYVTLSLNQKIYTPDNLFQKIPVYGDRPYAGVLYLSSSHAFINDSSAVFAETRIGTLGRQSYSESVQKGVHSLPLFMTGSGFISLKPEGWDHQMPDTGILNTSVSGAQKMNRNISFRQTASLGNLDSSLGLSMLFTFGTVNADTYLNGHSIDAPMLPGGRSENSESEFYFFFLPSLKYQAYDGTMQSLGRKEKNGVFLNRFFNDDFAREKYSNDLYRFGYFKMFYRPDNTVDTVQDHLVFNTVFNGGYLNGAREYKSFYSSLLNDWAVLNSETQFLLLYNLFFYNKIDYETARFVGTREMLKNIFPGNETHQNLVLSFLAASGEFKKDRRNYPENRPVQGSIQTGLGFGKGRFYGNISYTVSTADFKPAAYNAQFHQWFGFQLSYRF